MAKREEVEGALLAARKRLGDASVSVEWRGGFARVKRSGAPPSAFGPAGWVVSVLNRLGAAPNGGA